MVQAAFAALQQQEAYGDFHAGEWDALLKAGERSIKREGVVDANVVFEELRRESQKRRRARKSE